MRKKKSCVAFFRLSQLCKPVLHKNATKLIQRIKQIDEYFDLNQFFSPYYKVHNTYKDDKNTAQTGQIQLSRVGSTISLHKKGNKLHFCTIFSHLFRYILLKII